MNSSNPVAGSVTKFAVGDSLPVDEQYDFLECGIVKEGTHVSSDEYIRGELGRFSDGVRQGPYKVGGPVKLRCFPAMLENWLPRIIGPVGSSGTTGNKYQFPDNGGDLDEFNAVVDRSAKVHTYQGCLVNKATFRGAKGQIVTLELDVQGQIESEGAAGSFPSLSVITGSFFMFNDGTIILNGSERKFDNFELSIDWKRELELFNNSITRTGLPSQDREVHFACDVPYNAANADLYNQNVTGAAGTILFQNGSDGLQFNMKTLQVPAKTPPIVGKKPVFLRIEGIVRGTTGSDELVLETT